MESELLDLLPDDMCEETLNLELENLRADEAEYFCEDCGGRLSDEEYINSDHICEKCWCKSINMWCCMHMINDYHKTLVTA